MARNGPMNSTELLGLKRAQLGSSSFGVSSDSHESRDNAPVPVYDRQLRRQAPRGALNTDMNMSVDASLESAGRGIRSNRKVKVIGTDTPSPLMTFAQHAAAFRDWAAHGADTGREAARNALLFLSRLHLAALELPSLEGVEPSDDDAEHVGHQEWEAVFKSVGRRLPLDNYGKIFDPMVVPPEEFGIGSLADDLADIYGDVVSGLREYDAGRHDTAHFEWVDSYGSHWGHHATSAINALMSWLRYP